MMTESEHRARIVALAGQWISTPYRHQGSIKSVGCDCLGLVRGIWRELYGNEPVAVGPYSMDWAQTDANEPLLTAAYQYFEPAAVLKPGSLLVFRWRRNMSAKHLGICVAADRFIHAYERASVIESHLVPQWRSRIAGIFDFPQLQGD